MKCVIRRGVFETNSSSTHSVTYGKKPKEFTYELVSAWSRLYMLKALLNATCEPWRVELQAEMADLWDDDEDLEAAETEEQAAESEVQAAEGKEPEDEDFDLEDEEQEEREREPFVSPLQNLYDACVKVFCETEGIDPDALKDYLADKAVAHFCPGAYKERFRKYFMGCFDAPGCDLCSCIFEEGVLDMCTCNYDSGRLDTELFMQFIDRVEDRYPAMAKEYLYGERDLFLVEHYAGCKTIDAKIKV